MSGSAFVFPVCYKRDISVPRERDLTDGTFSANGSMLADTCPSGRGRYRAGSNICLQPGEIQTSWLLSRGAGSSFTQASSATGARLYVRAWSQRYSESLKNSRSAWTCLEMRFSEAGCNPTIWVQIQGSVCVCVCVISVS